MFYKKWLPRQRELKLEGLGDENAVEGELLSSLSDNEQWIQETFANCTDLMIRKLQLFDSIPCIIVFFQELIDMKQLDEELLSPLLKNKSVTYGTVPQLIESIELELVPVAKTKRIHNRNEMIQHILGGEAVLLLEGSKQGISVNVKENQLHRGLKEPETEAVIRGPRVGFIENIYTNMALIRQQIRTPQLKVERMTIGAITQTELAILYVENISPPEVITEMKRRLSRIKLDSVLESGYIEEMIRDAPYSPFPVLQMSERPDTVAACLIEGKVALLINGTPMSLIAPVTFWHGFQSAEDFYTSYIFSTFLRWLRYFFAFLSLTLPSLFIAVMTYHQEMIPTSLTLSLAAARETVPFPTFVETLLMEITFEAIREAGIRLPRPVGQTISIVGVLVIGQAAVQAGIVSNPIVMIVSLTGIASFLIPNTNMSQAIRILRFPLMLFAGIFGLYGFMAVMLALLIHLVNLRSFGVPYMAPLAPFSAAGIWDILVRAPWWVLHKRQHHIHTEQEMEKK
ncbi:spore germination protein [Paenibacillus rigui]|uniref:Spore germination protein n=1 Tax=Paenibacillus rigui TaxID=554312 RepID=A0A229UUT0_9BACL|nr:spore germination protein [Paenibacillus rigui]OXM87286.1 spore germination protein [Paenibacillus rigui]